MKNAITTILSLTLALTGGASLAGLTTGSAGCGPPPEDNDPQTCGNCSTMVIFCQVPSSNNQICVVDEAHGQVLCPEGWTSSVDCSGNTGGQQAWDPDQYITFNRVTGKYDVDQQLLDDVQSDGWVLIAQDRARLVEQAGGYFKLENPHADDLATHLGLQDGDIVKKANLLPLQTWDDYATAITQLDGATSFTIEVTRDGNNVTLEYEVI